MNSWKPEFIHYRNLNNSLEELSSEEIIARKEKSLIRQGRILNVLILGEYLKLVLGLGLT